MWRAIAFLRRNQLLNRNEFIARVEELLHKVATCSPAPAKTVLNLPMNPMPQDLKGMFGDRFDAVVELWFDHGTEARDVLRAIAANESIVHEADAAIDKASSHAWLAEVVEQVPPPAELLRFFVAGQVADGLTVKDAQEYWRTEHPRVFLSVEDFRPYIAGYTQMHGRDILVKGEIDWLALASFYPMCAEMGLRTAEDVVAAYALPSYLAIVRPDEERFSKPADMLSFASDRQRFF